MGALALTNGEILSCVPGEAARYGVVLIRDGVIGGIFDSPREAQREVGSGVQSIDALGGTILPGMIDCHVHLFLSGDADAMTNRELRIEAAVHRAALHLRAGATTVRDLGGPQLEVLDVRDRITAGELLGARVVAAGAVITRPNGHGSFMGRTVRTRDELVRAVGSAAEAGVDCIKIMASGGVSTPASDVLDVPFSLDDLSAAVEAAHAVGLTVAAHASNAEAIRRCVAAGVDSIEHGIMIDDHLAEAVATSESVLVPTLVATDLPAGFFGDERIPRFIREKARLTIPPHRSSVARAIAAGAAVVGGTDAGTTLTGHGLIAREAAELVTCGLSNEEAIAAVTRDAARLLGIGHKVGTLEPGKIADVVVVDGRPADDIANLAKVRGVIKDGVLVHWLDSCQGTQRG